MKTLHNLLLLTIALTACMVGGLSGTIHAQQKADFGGQASPYHATIVVKSVDFETSQNLDLLLPDNFTYIVESVQTVVRTAPSAVTTAPRVGVASYDGSTATTLLGTVAAEANAAGEIDTIFSFDSTAHNGYHYTEDVAAATTSGLCTQNTTLNTPGSLAGVTSPLHPRKIRVVTVDNAGDDLAGTVTLNGTNAQGEVISETITIAAGTDTHDSISAFATLTSATHDFGETGEATNDTLNLGMDDQVALPFKNSRVFRALTAGVADTVASQDVAEGTYALTDVPDGITEQEVYFRTVPVPAIIAGGKSVRIVVTGGTVTGSDVRDVIVRLLKY